jgi:hypothetical protein
MKPSQDTTPAPALTTLSEVLHWSVGFQQLHKRLAPHFARPEPFQRAALRAGHPERRSWQAWLAIG